jgi:hypothetical protein
MAYMAGLPRPYSSRRDSLYTKILAESSAQGGFYSESSLTRRSSNVQYQLRSLSHATALLCAKSHHL